MTISTISLLRPLTTKEFAEAFTVSVGRVWNAHSGGKPVYGIEPIRLPNGHLRWPADKVAEVLGQGGGHAK